MLHLKHHIWTGCFHGNCVGMHRRVGREMTWCTPESRIDLPAKSLCRKMYYSLEMGDWYRLGHEYMVLANISVLVLLKTRGYFILVDIVLVDIIRWEYKYGLSLFFSYSWISVSILFYFIHSDHCWTNISKQFCFLFQHLQPSQSQCMYTHIHTLSFSLSTV